MSNGDEDECNTTEFDLSCLPTKECYGEHYQEHFFEQYKLFTDSSIKVTEWRISANTYFLSVCTFLVTMFGLAASFEGTLLWQRCVAIAGAVLCVIWLIGIRSYKRLNSSKFKVIHQMEKQLPFAPFDFEWQVHKKKSWHRALSSVESWVPIAFATLFVALCLISIAGEKAENPTRIKIDATISKPVKVDTQ